MKQLSRERWIFLGLLLVFIFTLSLPIKSQERSDTVFTRNSEKNTVIFRDQDEQNRIQSFSSVSGEQLENRPNFQMGTALYGVLPGLNVTLTNGTPSSLLSYSLRGTTPIVLVDGIPRSAVNLTMSQIESVTVIKDALGQAMMGMMGGNGIVNIITKKGKSEKLKISASAQFASSQQMFRPNFVNSADYAILFNQALRNDNRTPMYTQTDIDKYKNNSSPYTHPNINWSDYVLKDKALTQLYNLNFTGGNSTARYFIDLNYFNEGGYVKEDQALNSYSTGDKNDKYSLRTSIDIDLSEKTHFSASAYGQMQKENTNGAGIDSLYYNIALTPNSAYAPLNPDNTLGGTHIYTNNIYGQTVHSGYRTYNSSDLNLDLNLKQEIGGIFEGMYLSTRYSYSSIYREIVDRSKARAIFGYQSENGNETYTQYMTSGAQVNSSSYNRQNRSIYYDVALGYDFSSGLHNSSSKLVYSYNNYLVQNHLPFINKGLSGSFQYDYDKKYLAEFTFAYSNMNQFKKGHQNGFFPAFGAGWNLIQEDLFKEKLSDYNVNLLKLRSSYGIVGDNLAANYYATSTGTLPYYYDYMYYYLSSGSAYFSNAVSETTTIKERSLPYTTTWAKSKKFNIGLDLGLNNNAFMFTAEYFINNMSDILQGRIRNNSGIVGAPMPSENLGKVRISGFEFDLSYNKSIGNLNVNLAGNALVYNSKVIDMNEPAYPESYMLRTGKPTTQLFGYVADGFFQSQEEINQYSANTKIVDYIPQPGDIKYKDINKDGLIDGKDITEIGHSKPLIQYGLFGEVSWKGFGVSMQWAGVANKQGIIQDMPFQNASIGGYGQVTTNQMDVWSPENKNAAYPRLSVGGNSYNQRTSSFWLKNADYLRLKHLEIFYNLPKTFTDPLNLSNLKLFVSGYNLLTISSIKDRDPELINYEIYPNTKSISVGVNVQF